MDTELKNRIKEFLEMVISTHDEPYPALLKEQSALIDATASEFKIDRNDAVVEVLNFL